MNMVKWFQLRISQLFYSIARILVNWAQEGSSLNNITLRNTKIIHKFWRKMIQINQLKKHLIDWKHFSGFFGEKINFQDSFEIQFDFFSAARCLRSGCGDFLQIKFKKKTAASSTNVSATAAQRLDTNRTLAPDCSRVFTPPPTAANVTAKHEKSRHIPTFSREKPTSCLNEWAVAIYIGEQIPAAGFGLLAGEKD